MFTVCYTLFSVPVLGKSNLQSGGAQSLAGRPGCSGPWLPCSSVVSAVQKVRWREWLILSQGSQSRTHKGQHWTWSVTSESVIRMMEVDDGGPGWGHSLNKADAAESSVDRNAVCHFLDRPSSYHHSSSSPSVSSQLATPLCVALKYPTRTLASHDGRDLNRYYPKPLPRGIPQSGPTGFISKRLGGSVFLSEFPAG